VPRLRAVEPTGPAPSAASAVDDAGAAAEAAGVEIRPLTTLEEALAATRVMVATWGSTQNTGHELLRAMHASGNVLLGAFDSGRMVGFVFGFYGRDEEGWHHHSHMLAAVPERRHAGVGFALKLAQRAAVLDAGVGLMRWTFDPLIARNAWFNLGKLGAVCDRFHRNFYGAMDDEINRGERTDRLEVRWELEASPPGGGSSPEEAAATVAVPVDYAELRSEDPASARSERERAARELENCFDRGLVATWFDRLASAYVFVAGGPGSGR
jgi:predicted GNAT superfamily acetyltransferase